MTEYKNLNGNSGIVAFEIFPTHIDVQFDSGSVYTYHKDSVGELNFSVMKTLAIAGAGLNAFINKFVRYKYTRRIPNSDTPSTPSTPTFTRENSIQEVAAVISELTKNFDVSLQLTRR